ncbi:6-bladed beta-propeller [uncultured Duncaniella sp.]|uniref:6-bladed beta-propeller n=1 Tax=uncultured Duncaniella sp. TaxID=2768039 RepID=UPI0026362BA4|nr:6-bladed beta-propeller [uncultured Duncaniella sp.]
MKKYCIPLLLATALYGCQSERNSQVCEAELPIIDCTIDKDSPRGVFDSIFEFKDYLLLETNEHSTLTRCSKIVFNDDNVYILDANKRIVAFGPDGRFLREYSHIGQGPGEYTYLGDFNIVNDSLYLLDGMKGRLYTYTLEDEFISDREIEKATGFRMLDNGIALNIGNGHADGNGEKSPYSYNYVSSNAGEPVVKAAPHNKYLCGYHFSFSSGDNSFFEFGDRIFTYFPLNDTIYTVSATDGSLSPLAVVRLGDNRVDADMEKGVVEALLKSDCPKSIFGFYNWGDTIMFSFVPGERQSSRTVIADLDGNVIFNGNFTMDSNKLPISAYNYDADKAHSGEILSLVQPFIIKRLVEHYDSPADYPLLHELNGKVTEEGNPVLIRYSKLKN